MLVLLNLLLVASFNPRLRTGGDMTIMVNFRITYVSIHASAREATFAVQQKYVPKVPFQSTPPHGRRHV